MDVLKQHLYGLTPYLFGALAFAVIFLLLMRRRVQILHPRRLWVLPAFTWILAAAIMGNALPQTGTQVVAFVVLVVTGFGIGVLLCLSDGLKHDPVTNAFIHKSSVLSISAAALIVALLIVYNPFPLWPGFVFISALVTGRSICLWRWLEYLRAPPETLHVGL